MKKSFKKIASLVMAMVLTLSMALNVSAADITDETPEKSTVKFTDIQEGFDFEFEPGSEYTTTDLFDGFKDVMPGDVIRIELDGTYADNDSDKDGSMK